MTGFIRIGDRHINLSLAKWIDTERAEDGSLKSVTVAMAVDTITVTGADAEKILTAVQPAE